jgi:hypothetical protein
MTSIPFDTATIADHLAQIVAQDVRAMMDMAADAFLVNPTPYQQAVYTIARSELGKLQDRARDCYP